MLFAFRTVVLKHREVIAVLATYTMFLSMTLALAWLIS